MRAPPTSSQNQRSERESAISPLRHSKRATDAGASISDPGFDREPSAGRHFFLLVSAQDEERHASSDADYLSTDNQQIDAVGASVVLVRTSPASGGIFSTSYSVRTTVRLTREADGWRISVPPDDYLLVSPPVRP